MTILCPDHSVPHPSVPWPFCQLVFCHNYVIQMRGFKMVVKYLPHQVSDMVPVLGLIARQDVTDIQVRMEQCLADPIPDCSAGCLPYCTPVQLLDCPAACLSVHLTVRLLVCLST